MGIGVEECSAGLRHAIVVLGMHRSGTSSLTGVLGLLGAAMPRTLMPITDDNSRGYWESVPVAALNDEILSELSSAWSDWRALPLDRLSGPSAEDYRGRAAALLDSEFGDAPLIALKDPRITRLFPFWRETLSVAGYRVGVLIPLRHPLEVAASLRARDAMPVAQGLMIWLGGVLEAELRSRGCDRHFLAWTDLLNDWRPLLASAVSSLEIDWPVPLDVAGPRIDAFLDVGLRHQTLDDALAAEPSANAWIRDTHAAMMRLVADAKSNEAMVELDRIRLEFAEAALLFGPSLGHVEQQGRQLALRAEALEATVADRERELERSLAQARAEAESPAADGAQGATELERRLVEVRDEAERRSAEAARRMLQVEQRLAQAQDDLNRLAVQAAASAREAAARAVALDDSERSQATALTQAAMARARLYEVEGRFTAYRQTSEARTAALEAALANLRDKLETPWRTAVRLTFGAKI
jgi:hypothetical protein